jgi:peptidoglycan/xylan/chitin deacetylase (PgdA/CDA1 family)
MRRGAAAAVVVLAALGVGAIFLVRGHHEPRPPAAPPLRRVAPQPRRRRPPPPRAARALRLPARLPSRRVVLPILMYHRIGPVKASLPPLTQRLTVPPAQFAAEMRWLVHNGFHAVTMEQAFEALEYGRPLPRRPVLITFDDGYRDVLWRAAPVLHRLHLRAVEFVITARTGGPDPSFLTWQELPRLERLGVEIGSHTVDHLPLTKLTKTQARAQLQDSRAALERHLGHPVQWFAYPFGAVNASVAALTRRAGYVLAVTTAPGEVQSGRAPLLLHRDEILDTTGVAGLAGLL